MSNKTNNKSAGTVSLCLSPDLSVKRLCKQESVLESSAARSDLKSVLGKVDDLSIVSFKDSYSLQWGIFENSGGSFEKPKGSFLIKRRGGLIQSKAGSKDQAADKQNNRVKAKQKKHWTIIRLDTNAVHGFSERLHQQGVSGLLTQQAQHVKPSPNWNAILDNSQEPLYNPAHLNFAGAYGIYYWELFFHMPFCIAELLRSHHQFKAARQWYQLIFNPSQEPLWSFLPFNQSPPILAAYAMKTLSTACSPDGLWLANFNDESQLNVWQRDGQGRLLSSQKLVLEPEQKIECLAFSHDSQYLAVGSRGDESDKKNMRLQVFHREKLKSFTLCFKHSVSFVSSLAFSPDDQWLIVREHEKLLLYYQKKTVREFGYIDQYLIDPSSAGLPKGAGFRTPSNLSFHPSGGSDGPYYFVVAFGVVSLWKLNSAKQRLKRVQGDIDSDKPESPMDGVLFSPDGEWLVTIDASKQVKLWKWDSKASDSTKLSLKKELWKTKKNKPTAVPTSLAFDSNRDWFAVGCENGTVQLWRYDAAEGIDTTYRVNLTFQLKAILFLSFDRTRDQLWVSDGNASVLCRLDSNWLSAVSQRNIDLNLTGTPQNSEAYDLSLLSYRRDPFDADGIANVRPLAYKKAFMMRYIDCLLDWGDSLFRQNTRSSILEAQLLYMRAYNLLGPTPVDLGNAPVPPSKTVQQLLPIMEKNSDPFIVLENVISASESAITEFETPYNYIPGLYFSLPENHLFTQYWDRVQDRLYKIRHSLSLEGVKETLSLFAPPIDPMVLVKTQANGGSVASVLNQQFLPLSYYRFEYLLEKARSLTERVIQLGASLLSAFEKKEAEALSLLHQTQGREILHLQQSLQHDQINQALMNTAALTASAGVAVFRSQYYAKLLKAGLSAREQSQIHLMIETEVLSAIAGALNTAASVGYAVPQIGSPFAMTYGGKQIGAVLSAVGGAAGVAAGITWNQGNVLAVQASFDRRKEEWQFQKDTADRDKAQIERQIQASQLQEKRLKHQLTILEKQIHQELSIETFLKDKFSSETLYAWLSQQLLGLYTAAFHLASDCALQAEKAMQYELALENKDTYIKGGYWHGLQKGLLAGEQLRLDLDRLEQAYLKKNQRTLEINKTISLLALDPTALLELKQTGCCQFNLTEALFDQDFPGHYKRQIKTIAVSFPAVLGPYENLNATLTQLSHKTLLKPDKEAVTVLLKGQGSSSLIREDWRMNEQIALSRGVNDNGLFQLNFQDARYLPFEGTGAVSTWELSLSPYKLLDIESITDVIIQLEYTALSDTGLFKAAVMKKVAQETRSQGRLFLLANEFPDAWHQLLTEHETTLKLHKNNFSRLSDYRLTACLLYAEPVNGKKTSSFELTVTLTSDTKREMVFSEGIRQHGLKPEMTIFNNPLDQLSLTLTVTSGQSQFTAATMRNLALVLFYQGQLDTWSSQNGA